jgi:hypothetical protein
VRVGARVESGMLIKSRWPLTPPMRKETRTRRWRWRGSRRVTDRAAGHAAGAWHTHGGNGCDPSHVRWVGLQEGTFRQRCRVIILPTVAWCYMCMRRDGYGDSSEITCRHEESSNGRVRRPAGRSACNAVAHMQQVRVRTRAN